MHTPNPGSNPAHDDPEPDVKQPPVPPDQAPEIVPQEDPIPGGPGGNPPLIAAGAARAR